MTELRLTAPRSALVLEVSGTTDALVSLRLRAEGPDRTSAEPHALVEILAAGHGRNASGPRYIETQIGRRLRYCDHTIVREGQWQTLSVDQRDDESGLRVTSVLRIHDECTALRAFTRVRNDGDSPITLQAVTSLVFSDFGAIGADDFDAFSITRGRNSWLAEGRWSSQSVRSAGLPQLRSPGRRFRTRGCIEAASVSSWPTVQELPAAVISDDKGARRWSFQIEHNGGWVWQVGELSDGLWLALLGPTDEHHGWQRRRSRRTNGFGAAYRIARGSGRSGYRVGKTNGWQWACETKASTAKARST